MATKTQHWTERNINAFVHRIATDFVSQLENRMEEKSVSNAELADSLSITAGRVSQILNNPGNLTLRNVVRCTRSLGMKAAIVAYDDGDADNTNGPINSEVFNRCWQNSGSPTDFFSLAESTCLNQRYLIYSSVNHGMGVSVTCSGAVSEIVGTNDSTQMFVKPSVAEFSTRDQTATWHQTILREQSSPRGNLQLTGERI